MLRHGVDHWAAEIGSTRVAPSFLTAGHAKSEKRRCDPISLPHGESLPLCVKLGDKRITSYTLLNPGELLEARSDLTEARKKYLEAIAVRDEIGVKLDAAEGRLSLGASCNPGKAAESR